MPGEPKGFKDKEQQNKQNPINGEINKEERSAFHKLFGVLCLTCISDSRVMTLSWRMGSDKARAGCSKQGEAAGAKEGIFALGQKVE